MSEIKPVSPLMDGLQVKEAFSNRGRTFCYHVTRPGSDEQFVLKHISIPESEMKIQALILTGAVPDEAGANAYYKTVAEDIRKEILTLQSLAAHGSIAPFVGYQVQPRAGVGFDVYLLMPRRKSLQSFLQEKAITQLQALNFGIDLCDVLSALHDEGLTFQNLKPENIFIDAHDHYVLGDLGLMPLKDLRLSAVPEYYLNDFSAPELLQLIQEPNAVSDLYALGMILYYIFNGNHLPFDDGTRTLDQARERRLRGTQLPTPKYADYELAEIIAKACSSSAAGRYETPGELRQALTLYMQRNDVSDHLLVPPLPLEEKKEEATPALEEAKEEKPEELSVPESLELSEEAAEGAFEEAAEVFEEAADEPDVDAVPERRETLDELLASVNDVLVEDVQEAAAPDLEANEAAQKDPTPTRRRKKAWISITIVLFVLTLVGGAFVYFYSNWYLVTMDALTVKDCSANSITVSYLLSTPDPELHWTCTDTYGNSFPGAAGEETVMFTNLTPGTQYTISFYSGKLHKLLGNTTISVATASLTEIVTLTAAPGGNSTTAEVSMVVSGPEPEGWLLTYSSSSGDSGSVTFTGHSVLVPELQLHEHYLFELRALGDIFLSGQTSCELAMQATVQAKNLQVSSATEDSLTVTWESLADAPLSWTVKCTGEDYDETQEVTDCVATFQGTHLETAYTFNVSAEGLEVPLSISLPANATVITALEAEPLDAGTVEVTWSCTEPLPEGGWIVHYLVGGDEALGGRMAAPEEQMALLRGLPANSEIVVRLEAANGDGLIGVQSITTATPEATEFGLHAFSASDSELKRYALPEKEDWTYDDLGDEAEEFAPGQELAVVLQAPEEFTTWDQDETSITLVLRGENGRIAKYWVVSCTWNDMWNGNRYLTSAQLPDSPGHYQLELYFDNQFVQSCLLTVAEEETPQTEE